MDEVSSTYTREEVAALVEESRGEGLLEDGEYDRLAGALGFTEKTVDDVLLPPDDAADRTPRLDRRATSRRLRRRPASAASRWSATTASCSATCTSRTCSRPTTHGRAAGDRGQVDPPVRHRARRRPPARHPGEAAAQGAHMARVVDDAGAVLGVATLEDVIEELVGEIRDAAQVVTASSKARASESPKPRLSSRFSRRRSTVSFKGEAVGQTLTATTACETIRNLRERRREQQLWAHETAATS